MKRLVLLPCLFFAFAFSQSPPFTNFVVGSAEPVGGSVNFYLENVSNCVIEEVSLRVAHNAVYYTTDATDLVVRLQPGQGANFAMRLSQVLSEGWGWTVDQIVVDPSPNCAYNGLVSFDRVDFRALAGMGDLPASSAQSYTVQRGDSLWGIAQRYGTTVDAILQANGLSGTTVAAGTTLQIPSGASSTPADSDLTLVHTIQAGETLWTLSQRYGTTVALIEQANCLPSGYVLSVGTQLRIPPAGATTVAGNC